MDQPSPPLPFGRCLVSPEIFPVLSGARANFCVSYLRRFRSERHTFEHIRYSTDSMDALQVAMWHARHAFGCSIDCLTAALRAGVIRRRVTSQGKRICICFFWGGLSYHPIRCKLLCTTYTSVLCRAVPLIWQWSFTILDLPKASPSIIPESSRTNPNHHGPARRSATCRAAPVQRQAGRVCARPDSLVTTECMLIRRFSRKLNLKAFL